MALFFARTILLLGSALCLMAQSDAGGYAGPAILSRGETPGTLSAVPIAFRPYIGVSGDYSTDLQPSPMGYCTRQRRAPLRNEPEYK
jgi:hypothetical protein